MTEYTILDVNDGSATYHDVEADSPGEAAIKWAIENDVERTMVFVDWDNGNKYIALSVSKRIVSGSNGAYSLTISAKPSK